ncbi:MAG: DUF2007 domain-containing protein [Planctomycetaceae bacterium]|nr:DUF2007 domain-containing protein [Planctomycetaceae bacterium]
MSDKFAVLRECADQFEAQTIRIRLAAEKIPVLITGTDPNFALSLGGAPTSRPVRVEVEHSDLERADTLLKQDQLRATQAESWICCRCHEQNEPTFDVCWSCNKMHDEATANSRKKLVPSESKSGTNSPAEVAERREQNQVGTVPKSKDEPPLLAVKNLQQAPSAPTPTGHNQESQADSVSRCARSAVVGLLLFPPLLNFYSIYLLLNLDPTVYRNSDTQLRVWSIWIFNAAVVSFGATLWWLLLFRR